MKNVYKFNMCGFIIGVLILGVVILLALSYKRTGKDGNENYGGPVNVVAYPPLDVCEKRCEDYKKWCMANYGSNDAGRCLRDKQACLSTCKYGYRK